MITREEQHKSKTNKGSRIYDKKNRAQENKSLTEEIKYTSTRVNNYTKVRGERNCQTVDRGF